MTNDLVEQMVGHRTRLVQQRPEEWHETEDAALARTTHLSACMDRLGVVLRAVPHLWLLVALGGLGPTLIAGRAAPTALGIAVAGVLLAGQALTKLVEAAADLGGAAIAWARVAPLFRAAAGVPEGGAPELALLARAGRRGESAVLAARGLSYTHAGRAEPTLRGLTLRVRAGERILFEGPSGSGKSTLAALLAGLRRPDDGLLLVGGLDYPTLGAEGWARRVVISPQFHENHIVTETLAFNLLLSRWPPAAADMLALHELLVELGLGPLVARMPAGLLQMVGEGGWQLSHGERSRVYLARALLQGAEVVILDESFGALDPETLDRCLACVLRRAPTLLVIAHP
jgi:ATP-binding cassette subfamily B protein